MTRSKLEFATILANLRGDGSDPAVLAKDMSLVKLCYEIQKFEEKPPTAPSVPTPKKKHIFSWLLDASDDES